MSKLHLLSRYVDDVPVLLSRKFLGYLFVRFMNIDI